MPEAVSVAIDLAALRSNIGVVRNLVGARRGILACVKANAYGHGLVPCARAALQAGACGLGVARVDEAATLRDAGVRGRIVLLGPEALSATGDLVAMDVEILVDSMSRLDAVADAASRLGREAAVHLALDTGMGRFGADEEKARSLADRIGREAALRWVGVMTHFAVADTDVDWTRRQWERFDRLTSQWAAEGMHVPTRHAANSAAVIWLPDAHADMVRPGLMMYGMQPCAERPLGLLKPVMQWRTQIAALHDHAAGDSIGYGRTFVATRRTVVATLPVGYGDGLPWSAGNRAWVLVRGHRTPVVGRISMDQTTVDVTDVPDAALGDEVVLMGRQGAEEITAEEWASWAGTINYEVTTRLLPRAPRIYTDA